MITLTNKTLTVVISPLGAELQSIKSADGTEYLWQGDPTFWKSRATNLFPVVGRLQGQSYTVAGEKYDIGIHGFLRHAQTQPRQLSDTEALFELEDNEDTRKQYPFSFVAGVQYRLEDSTLHIAYRVHNSGDSMMYFGLGGHPGFNIPLEKGLAFEDYMLCLDGASQRLLLSPSYLMSWQSEPFPLKDGCLPLRHDLFDDDAIVLKRTGGTRATLRSLKGTRSVTLDHPHMPYLGIWHKPHSQAPFVCLEPWLSLPGRDGVTEALETQPDLVHLAPGKDYANHWSITIAQ
ncbi:MAG: aldose 1-epimerase family protein [Clostridiales bacterium]|nr:aldose 1-epimerase family protein [Clostridiales bacterium]